MGGLESSALEFGGADPEDSEVAPGDIGCEYSDNGFRDTMIKESKATVRIDGALKVEWQGRESFVCGFEVDRGESCVGVQRCIRRTTTRESLYSGGVEHDVLASLVEEA